MKIARKNRWEYYSPANQAITVDNLFFFRTRVLQVVERFKN